MKDPLSLDHVGWTTWQIVFNVFISLKNLIRKHQKTTRHWVLSLESPNENLSFTLSSANPDFQVLVSLLKGRLSSLGLLEPRDLGMHECTWEGFLRHLTHQVWVLFHTCSSWNSFKIPPFPGLIRPRFYGWVHMWQVFLCTIWRNSALNCIVDISMPLMSGSSMFILMYIFPLNNYLILTNNWLQ